MLQAQRPKSRGLFERRLSPLRGRSNTVAEALANYLPQPLAYLLVGLLQCVLLLLVPFIGAMFFVWVERKVSARIQDRLGPTRCGGKYGWLQLLADGLKLITKEDLRPKDADAVLFRLAPYVSFCASFAAAARRCRLLTVGLRTRSGRRRVLYSCRAGSRGVRRDLGRLCLGTSKWSLFGRHA